MPASRLPSHAFVALLLLIVAAGTLAFGDRSPVMPSSSAAAARTLRMPALDPVDADLRELLRRLPALQTAAAAIDADTLRPLVHRDITIRAPLASDAMFDGEVPVVTAAQDGAVHVRVPVRRADRLIAIVEARLQLPALAGQFDLPRRHGTLVMLDDRGNAVFAVPAAAHRAQARIAEWLHRTDVAALQQRPAPLAPTIAIAAAASHAPTSLELALLVLAAALAYVLLERLRSLQQLLDACGARHRASHCM